MLMLITAMPMASAAQPGRELTHDPPKLLWSAGASFDVRDRSPTGGFGFRLEREMWPGYDLGLVTADIRLRIHFATLTEFTDSYRHLEVPVELTAYDFGLSALAMSEFFILEPYLGPGIGWEVYNAYEDGFGPKQLRDLNPHVSLIAGTRLPIHPHVAPFVEYRFSQLIGTESYTHSRQHRLSFGVAMNF